MTLEGTLQAIKHELERIASALEYLVIQPRNDDDVWASDLPTQGNQTAEKPKSGQTTWEWLGVTPPAIRKRAKAPITVGKRDRRGAEPGNTRAGQCGRCGRPGRRRLNGLDYCRDCRLESDEKVESTWFWKE